MASSRDVDGGRAVEALLVVRAEGGIAALRMAPAALRAVSWVADSLSRVRRRRSAAMGAEVMAMSRVRWSAKARSEARASRTCLELSQDSSWAIVRSCWSQRSRASRLEQR